MKKTTLLIFTLIFGFALSAQNSTGIVDLSTSLGYTAEIDVSTTTVTLTLNGPSGGYLGIGFGVSSMTSGGDVLIYEGVTNQISDRTFVGVGSIPTLDATQEWSATTTDNGTTVNIVATRPITSTTGGYTFNTTDTSIMLVWAHRPGTYSLGYHGGGTKGATTAGLTLSAPQFDVSTKFSIYPNPSSNLMNIKIPTLTDEGLKLEVYDVLGKKVYSQELNELSSSINIEKWNSGLYLVRISSPDQDITLTKRFVKL